MRVDLANAILQDKDLIVFDEFTSVVDREVAKVGSFATQKAIRKTNKKFVAVSCHYDVQDWLLPDWVFNTNSMEFTKLKKKTDLISNLEFSRLETKQSIGDYLVDTII